MSVFTSREAGVTLYVRVDNDAGTAVGTRYLVYNLPLRSENINQRADTLTSEAIMGKRTMGGALVTKRVYEGSIDVELFDVTGSITQGQTTTEFSHELLALLLYTIAGRYASNSVTFNPSKAPKIDFLEVKLNSTTKIIYQDCYVTGLSLRFPADAVPTATIDIRALGTATATPSTNTLTRNVSFTNFYNSKNLTFRVGSNTIDTIRNFEISFSQNVIDATAFGSLDVKYVEPANVEPATINVEFYIRNSATSLSLSQTLNTALGTAWDNGAASTSAVILEITSPTVTTKKATLQISSPIVVEYTHDLSANEFVVGKLGLRANAENITLNGVSIITS